MTRDELLEKAFPAQIERIRELCSQSFLSRTVTTSAGNELATGFNWHDTDEGHEFWNELYESDAGGLRK